MTEKQKEQITELRRNGLTYDNIGKRMGLPTGQIRSFCLSRIPVRDTDNQEEGEQAYCKTCGKMLVHTPGYRKKIFCSDGCRQDWWNHYAQIKTGKGWATNEVICQGCGKTFATYGVKRKYCSRKCYVEKKRNQ
ncbi:MAG: RNA polymerase subunit sigma-70 [Bacteroidetes bacterium]|nr:RNA polymerase subunit sigma-70 [Bacteroidota bacterium]